MTPVHIDLYARQIFDSLCSRSLCSIALKISIGLLISLISFSDSSHALSKRRVFEQACLEQQLANEFPSACVKAFGEKAINDSARADLNSLCIRATDIDFVSAWTLQKWLSWPHWVGHCRKRLEGALAKRRYQEGFGIHFESKNFEKKEFEETEFEKIDVNDKHTRQ